MKTFICSLIVLLTIILPVQINSQTLKTGTTSAQVLKLNVGPRAIGMGGAFTSVADDISAIYWNPGGTANLINNSVFFNHTNLFLDINHDFAAFTTHLSDIGTVGAFVSVLSMDEMLVRTLEKPEGTGEYFDAGSIVIGVNFSRYLTDNFAIGFNVKYISENIWNMNATGFGIDIGTVYKIPVLNEFRIASSISNFGTKMRLEGRDVIVIYPVGPGGENLINTNLELDKFDLPLLFRVGISADLIKEGSSRLTTAVDAVHPNDHTEYLNLGGEYAWKEIVMLRAGYNSLFERDSEKGLTLGIGFAFQYLDYLKIRFDYAYQDFGRLDELHYFSLGIDF
ncbi:MAG: PorV/PorQ family protein [Ignavibacteriaceae bacterium]|jgi:hypothetical protein|nr:PorV/PorQ family protein [Ignavibacteriaceae bacterium]